MSGTHLREGSPCLAARESSRFQVGAVEPLEEILRGNCDVLEEGEAGPTLVGAWPKLYGLEGVERFVNHLPRLKQGEQEQQRRKQQLETTTVSPRTGKVASGTTPVLQGHQG